LSRRIVARYTGTTPGRRHRAQLRESRCCEPALRCRPADPLHAIRKKEDKQPAGNLARATYSAYNGGPGQLGRYRNAKTPAVWKRVDDAFWTKFRAVSAGQELAVKSCYGQ
jgi:hypothetical protein